MARPPAVLRPVSLHTGLPEDLHAKLTLYLYSESEKRVPRGAYQKFIIDRIVEFFNRLEHSNDDTSFR
jgi:hypothetical protein